MLSLTMVYQIQALTMGLVSALGYSTFLNFSISIDVYFMKEPPILIALVHPTILLVLCYLPLHFYTMKSDHF